MREQLVKRIFDKFESVESYTYLEMFLDGISPAGMCSTQNSIVVRKPKDPTRYDDSWSSYTVDYDERVVVKSGSYRRRKGDFDRTYERVDYKEFIPFEEITHIEIKTEGY